VDPFPEIVAMDRGASLGEEALGALGNADVGLRIRLLVRLGIHYCNSSELEKAESSLEEAVALAHRHGDLALGGLALRARAWHALACNDPVRALSLANEARSLSERAGDALLAAEAGLDRLSALTALGRIRASEPELEQLVHEVESRRLLALEPFVVAHRAMRAALGGRFADAYRLVDRALVCAERIESPAAPHVDRAQRLWLGSLTGEPGNGLDQLQHEAVRRPDFAGYRITLAYTYAELRRPDAARREFELAAAGGFGRIPRGISWLILVARAGDACAHLADRVHAAELYRMLLPHAHLNAIQGHAIGCCGATARILGRLAAVLQRWKTAEQHFEDALSMNEQMGSPPWVAHTQVDYADLLRARNRGGDRRRAAELRERALSTAREIGMRPLEARILAGP
jgi:tetratricopeptide (TPR) repeat protein